MTNPFRKAMTTPRSVGVPAPEDTDLDLDVGGSDPFTEASSTFVKTDDLVGRLVLVRPLRIEERESRLPGSVGKKYESITADVMVCSGAVTETIPEIPFEVRGMFFSGTVITSQLKRHIGDRVKPICLGVVGQQPSQTKGFGDAWVLEKPNGADKDLARPIATAWIKTW